MHIRRGTTVLASDLQKQMSIFSEGDIVTSVAAGSLDFIGQVDSLDLKCAKVFVNWGSGESTQHGPDEIKLYPVQCSEISAKMMTSSRRGRLAEDVDVPAGDQFVGDPETHGIDSPRGGGFSIMQNLQKDLAPEMMEEAEAGPKIAPQQPEDLDEDGGDQNKAASVTRRGTSVFQERNASLASDMVQQAMQLLGGMDEVNLDMSDHGVQEVVQDFGVPAVKRALAKAGIVFKEGKRMSYLKLKNASEGRVAGTDIKSVSGKAVYESYDELYGEFSDLKDREERGDVSPGTYEKHEREWMATFESWVKKVRGAVESGDYTEFRKLASLSRGNYLGKKTRALLNVVGIRRARNLDDLFSQMGGVVTASSNYARLNSRRALYWGAPGRTYRQTKGEQEGGASSCPKCKEVLEPQPFTKSEKLLACPECGFKIPTGKVVNQKIEIEIEPDGTVEVEVEPAEVEASTRRGRMVSAEVPDNMSSMSIGDIAYLIYDDWGRKVNYAAKPYLEAMSSMRDINDAYGMDSGKSIVAYFLSNASSWRGEVAKAVKKELKKRLR